MDVLRLEVPVEQHQRLAAPGRPGQGGRTPRRGRRGPRHPGPGARPEALGGNSRSPSAGPPRPGSGPRPRARSLGGLGAEGLQVGAGGRGHPVVDRRRSPPRAVRLDQERYRVSSPPRSSNSRARASRSRRQHRGAPRPWSYRKRAMARCGRSPDRPRARPAWPRPTSRPAARRQNRRSVAVAGPRATGSLNPASTAAAGARRLGATAQPAPTIAGARGFAGRAPGNTTHSSSTAVSGTTAPSATLTNPGPSKRRWTARYRGRVPRSSRGRPGRRRAPGPEDR